MGKLLEVKKLKVVFNTYAGEIKAVRGIDFEVNEGETLAIVGESGCGKTVTAKSVLRLLNKSISEISPPSEVLFKGEDALKMKKKRLQAYRGKEVSMIFQNPMNSLNPTMPCGKQVVENLILHQKMSKAEAREKALEMFELVKIPDPQKRFSAYPHQLSGGMRQRVMIAIALACNPKLLIADEPTTALDVTIQAQIMALMSELKTKLKTAIVLVTHDLGVVANFADRVQVMYAGRIVERGTVREIFKDPKHPYTAALLKSIPKIGDDAQTKLYALSGTPPDLILPLEQCPFAERCAYCMKICKRKMPEEKLVSETHKYACWLVHPLAKAIKDKFDGRRYE